jgi:hypothetical protein
VIDLRSAHHTYADFNGSYIGVDIQVGGTVEVPTAEEAQGSMHSADQAPDLRRRASEIESEDED